MVLGTMFFCLSLTPSLLPRSYVLQGVLSGFVFAVGFAIGVFLTWLWHFLELPIVERPHKRKARALVAVLSLAAVIWFFTKAPGWQNSIGAVMGMEPVARAHSLQLAAIAIVVAFVLIGVGTLFTHGVRSVSRRLAAFLPRRIAVIGGMVIVGTVTALLVNGVLLRLSLQAADNFYAELDALAGQYEGPPVNPLQSGSAASLVPWDTIGRDARVYVRAGPTAPEIEAITSKPAQLPLRIYVGLRSAPSVEERARLALAEMIRVGAFERSVLVLIMPVGTGWVDPPAIDTLEMLHGGDVASVAVQYSYLTSWLSLLAEPNVGTETAQVLFSTVYEYWTQLPRETRPKLYLHGLSLGAYASQESMLLYDVLADPIQGALWAGPPFASRQWRSATDNRDPHTPRWLPRFGNSSTIRFTNQQNALEIPGAFWGPIRMVYLQYPSDPIVFFEPAALYRPPEWLANRAPDVSPELTWYPVVTFLQLALDMALAQTAPVGFGHVYAPPNYLDAWVEITQPAGWTEQELADLRTRLTRTGGVESVIGGWFR
ncbi:alpha/beta hydrolase [Devosia submarina]|uniref:alpha/beta hydrolase n=1 Tax=Devosia submarina TaxID=1173082 RepID=UPI000D3D78AD|nr:alpha/beta-hydrolase family protein [Devosia submarina]